MTTEVILNPRLDRMLVLITWFKLSRLYLRVKVP